MRVGLLTTLVGPVLFILLVPADGRAQMVSPATLEQRSLEDLQTERDRIALLFVELVAGDVYVMDPVVATGASLELPVPVGREELETGLLIGLINDSRTNPRGAAMQAPDPSRVRSFVEEVMQTTKDTRAMLSSLLAEFDEAIRRKGGSAAPTLTTQSLPMATEPVEVWQVELDMVDVQSQVRLNSSATLRIEFYPGDQVYAVASYATSGSWPDEFTGTIRDASISLTSTDSNMGGVFEGTIDTSGLFASGQLRIESQGWQGTWRATRSAAAADWDPPDRPARAPSTVPVEWDRDLPPITQEQRCAEVRDRLARNQSEATRLRREVAALDEQAWNELMPLRAALESARAIATLRGVSLPAEFESLLKRENAHVLEERLVDVWALCRQGGVEIAAPGWAWTCNVLLSGSFRGLETSVERRFNERHRIGYDLRKLDPEIAADERTLILNCDDQGP